MHSVEVGFAGRRGAAMVPILPLCARLEFTSLRGTLTFRASGAVPWAAGK